MNIIDKNWKYGTVKAFANVPAELLDFKPGCRVQPAPYVGKSQSFYLINRYEPGENKYFPEGGFECRGDGSARYSFDLDQVVVYQDEKVKISKPAAAKQPKKKVVTEKAKPAAAPEKKVVTVKTVVSKKATKATAKKEEKPVAKKAQGETVKASVKVCGAPKKDGTPCQMKTDGGLCRHHKAK